MVSSSKPWLTKCASAENVAAPTTAPSPVKSAARTSPCAAANSPETGASSYILAAGFEGELAQEDVVTLKHLLKLRPRLTVRANAERFQLRHDEHDVVAQRTRGFLLETKEIQLAQGAVPS